MPCSITSCRRAIPPFPGASSRRGGGGVPFLLTVPGRGWLPYVLTDAEKRLKRKGRRLAADPLKANNIWVTVETTDDIPYLIGRVGDDNLVIGTDYGHTDTSAQIEALRLLKENGKVPRASIDKILGPNATTLYALPANGHA